MRRIEPEALRLRAFHLLDQEWALLVAGTQRPNPMTVSWGGFGTIWNKPVATVFVRPSRFSFCLLETEPEFTLNILPPPFRSAMELCGSRSGRDLDKWQLTGLTPTPSETIKVPRVAQAELSFECRILASTNLCPSKFLDPSLEEFYPEKDYHRVYFGEVLAAYASERFLDEG